MMLLTIEALMPTLAAPGRVVVARTAQRITLELDETRGRIIVVATLLLLVDSVLGRHVRLDGAGVDCVQPVADNARLSR